MMLVKGRYCPRPFSLFVSGVMGIRLIDALYIRVYEEITLDYPLAAAKSFASLAKPFNFVYVSGNQLFQSSRIRNS